MQWPATESYVIWITNAVITTFLFVTIIGICRVIRYVCPPPLPERPLMPPLYTLSFRRQFKARVNCWFCNQNTWVPYLDRNQWTCPGCEQYNGFQADGDYNRDLHAQYSPKYNKQPVPRRQQQVNATVGGVNNQQLCATCNRNQELKVHQLASFTATEEANYDAEVQLYQQQLEEVYRLCPGCERIVRRRLNQAKTLILGAKRTVAKTQREKRRGKPMGLGGRLKQLVRQVLMLLVILQLSLYFIAPHLTALLVQGGYSATGWLLAGSAAMTLGYRLALGVTILILLSKGEPMSGSEYGSVLTLSSLHFLIGERLLQQSEVAYAVMEEYLPVLEWSLRVVALLASIAIFVESLQRTPGSGVKLNNSFHRIEVEEEEEKEREEQLDDDSGSLSYARSRLDNSHTSDFGSVFEYAQSVGSRRVTNPISVAASSAEDEEIRSISLNSSFNHNRSDPVVRQRMRSQQCGQGDLWTAADVNNDDNDTWGSVWSGKSPVRPCASTMSLHSPSSKLLYPDDRFSNSIQSMRIGGEYHQLQNGNATMMASPPSLNPFMKNVPLSASNSLLSSQFSGSRATLCGSTRSLLTPSRLSMAGGGPTGQSVAASSGSSWSTAGGGFWNNHYPNVFTAKSSRPSMTPSSFVSAAPKSIAAHSLDRGLDERFVPLTESRSSSQSSGFESRQSTSSQVPAFCPIGGGLSPGAAGELVDNEDRKSVFLTAERGMRTPGGREETWSDSMGMGSFFEPNVFPR